MKAWWSLLLIPTLALAEPPLPYLDCPVLNYFDDECVLPQRAPESVLPLPQAPAPPAPLFTPETMAKDAPPLMRELLNNPTEENLRRYVIWEQQRWERIQQVQRMLKAVQP